MDLKIKDVADLLNVSEATIESWLSEGIIPAYKINDQQYLFSRHEIEDWVMNRQSEKPHTGFSLTKKNTQPGTKKLKSDPKGGIKQFSLFRAVHKGVVIANVAGDTKDEVIRNALRTIAPELKLDAEMISDLLIDREKMHSTALNMGIAIPHARDFLLDAFHDIVVVAFPKNPIAFGALDGKPVHTLFFLFACDDKRHLHLLAKIAHLSSQSDTLAFLQQKPSKEQLLQYIKDWEGAISHAED